MKASNMRRHQTQPSPGPAPYQDDYQFPCGGATPESCTSTADQMPPDGGYYQDPGASPWLPGVPGQAPQYGQDFHEQGYDGQDTRHERAVSAAEIAEEMKQGGELSRRAQRAQPAPSPPPGLLLGP
jgi:hypothetical protein